MTNFIAQTQPHVHICTHTQTHILTYTRIDSYGTIFR